MSNDADFPREIERKFLLRQVPENLAGYPHSFIEQGYLAADRDGLQVRLRRKDGMFTLSFKRGGGTVREEREIALTASQFDALWPATDGFRIAKTRYFIPWQDHVVEIDVYSGRHEGLVVAEVEFTDEKRCADFVPPAWFGDDVSGDPRYSNVVLALQSGVRAAR